MSAKYPNGNKAIHSAIDENRMFHMMLDSHYEGIVYVDETGVIKYVNKAFADYNKMSIEGIIGRPHREIVHDHNIDRLLLIKDFYEPLVFVDINGRKFVTSRRPVYRNKKFAGVFSQYFSISPQDVIRKFGPNYINFIASLETKNIMYNVSQTILELDTYKDEFQKANIAKRALNNIIGNTAIMKDLKNKLLCISESNSTVLLTGESGTGKELFAQAIHFHSARCSGPFIKINCSAIPENLLESELFGYVEGAFTGARKGGKMGKFELANQGTIFMDEIGDMPLSMQAKLLRVLQEKEQLIAVLNQCRGRRKDAAAILRISKSTLYRLMKKHDLLDT